MEAEESSSKEKQVLVIHIHFCHGNYLVWDVDEVVYLRSKLKIIGGMIGSLSLRPRQNLLRTLPLKLSAIEANFLLTRELAVIQFVKPYFEQYFDENVSVEVENHRHDLHKAQKQILTQQKSQLLENKKSVIEEKKSLNKAKENSLILSNYSFQNLKRSEISKTNARIYENSWINFKIKTMFPNALSEKRNFDINFTDSEKLQYDVFCDLYDQGFYIANGNKFGGHFLIYPGDPFLYHASFIAICIGCHCELSTLELSAYGRLGNSVKKTLLLCSKLENGSIFYSSIFWSGIVS